MNPLILISILLAVAGVARLAGVWHQAGCCCAPAEPCAACQEGTTPKKIAAVFAGITLCDCANFRYVTSQCSVKITQGDPNQAVVLAQDPVNPCIWRGTLTGPFVLNLYYGYNCINFNAQVQFTVEAVLYRYSTQYIIYLTASTKAGRLFFQKASVAYQSDCGDVPAMNNKLTEANGCEDLKTVANWGADEWFGSSAWGGTVTFSV